MTRDEIIRFAASLPGVAVETASEGSGAPQIAWGDSFIFYDPERNIAPDRRFPFATIVTKDYPGWDEFSNLDREGVYRLNVNAGRDRFAELFGCPPAEHADHTADIDYAAIDTLLPHPTYARQAWVSILNSGPHTSDQARTLITEAHARASARHKPAV
jgi:hypothetical protein